MQTSGSSAPAIGNFEQPVLPIADPPSFSQVKSAIERCFSQAGVEGFLRSLNARNIRIREFEAALGQGLLGPATKAEYSKLGDADQGQIREFYLASLEHVSPELRQKFFKLYAYY